MNRTTDGQPDELPTKDDCAFECIQYILEHEREDFWENPDRYHIFFYAMAHAYGNEHALASLKTAQEAIK